MKKTKTYEIEVEGIKITVVKKRMKNLYLRIKKEDGSVWISAPLQVSDARIKKFALERMEWVKENQAKYEALNKERGEQPILSDAEIKRRKVLLKAAVEKLVKKWEPLMQVKVSGITIRRMKTRWGSCNVNTHHININLSLYDKGPECLEYVVVHEMCHILEPSHNKVFWGYMTGYYPNWKEIRKQLNNEVVYLD